VSHKSKGLLPGYASFFLTLTDQGTRLQPHPYAQSSVRIKSLLMIFCRRDGSKETKSAIAVRSAETDSCCKLVTSLSSALSSHHNFQTILEGEGPPVQQIPPKVLSTKSHRGRTVDLHPESMLLLVYGIWWRIMYIRR
jgi:hypothetical protein